MNLQNKNSSRSVGKAGIIIAIDGPAGAGKSTTAKIVAARLGYQYLDTGAMYRALTYYSLTNNIPATETEKLTKIAFEISIEFETTENLNKVFLNSQDITAEIRTPEVTKAVSAISAIKGVREAMVAKQKEIGKAGSIVAEGRDTTTVVFPEAELKIYLDASVEQRAERRLLDMTRQGITTTLKEQQDDIIRRDNFDSQREHSPLTKSPEAMVVDTTKLTIDEQVDRIILKVKSVVQE